MFGGFGGFGGFRGLNGERELIKGNLYGGGLGGGLKCVGGGVMFIEVMEDERSNFRERKVD